MKEVIGTIDHRILLNFRIAPEVMTAELPPEFQPKLVNGYAIGGICQVSLSQMRPKGVPALVTARSHNAAHRVAVLSSQGEGVFVLRRDTGSRLNALTGGRIFPGVYSKADFQVESADDRYVVKITDGNNRSLMHIDATVSNTLPKESVFEDTKAVSDFFKGGNVGWSKRNGGGFDAIELVTPDWDMSPMFISEAYSAYFSNNDLFPPGSVEFDSAMIMRNLQHSWVTREELCEICC